MSSRVTQETRSIMRRVLLDARCEATGNVWLADAPRWTGDPPLFVRSGDLVSGRYGRMERRAGYVLASLAARGLPVSAPASVPPSLGDSQIAALRLALSSDVSVITGGPGTGKTTVARTVASAHTSILGLSPTGKGADRLASSLGVECYTVHRATYQAAQMDKDGRPLLDFGAYDLIVLDEAGMLAVDTLDLLCSALHKAQARARLVFLGDTDQLPSVGPGKVLADLIASLPSARLDVTYRFSDADIGTACESARAGKLHRAETDAYRLVEGSEDRAVAEYRHLVARYGLPEVRLITPLRIHARLLNGALMGRGDRPIMCTRNNYRAVTVAGGKCAVFNGQQGWATSLGLVFGANTIEPRSILWSYAYAATCHRSQGGEWDGVVVYVPSARWLSREWMLTALSRAAKELVLVLGDGDKVEQSLAHAPRAGKRTTLLSRFIGYGVSGSW